MDPSKHISVHRHDEKLTAAPADVLHALSSPLSIYLQGFGLISRTHAAEQAQGRAGFADVRLFSDVCTADSISAGWQAASTSTCSHLKALR